MAAVVAVVVGAEAVDVVIDVDDVVSSEPAAVVDEDPADVAVVPADGSTCTRKACSVAAPWSVAAEGSAAETADPPAAKTSASLPPHAAKIAPNVTP